MAYLDGAIPGEERYAIESHIDACDPCTTELDELRGMSDEFSAAVALTDVAPPMLRARARLQPYLVGSTRPAPAARTGRRMATAPLLKAAAIVLLLAGAASAAIPDSPLRRLVESIAERAAALVSGPDAPVVVESPDPVVATPPAAEQRQPGNEWGVAPLAGGARVTIHEPVSGATIAVRLVDEDRVRVTAISADDTRVVTGTGYMDVFENTTGLIIEVPRDLDSMTVEVDGRLYFVKDGDRTRTPGPGALNRPDEFVFQAHTR
jgi:anti-sigma factor RsiW